MTSDAFQLTCDDSQGGIAFLGANRPEAINFLMQGQTLGAVEISVRSADGGWTAARTADSDDVREHTLSPDGDSYTVAYLKPSKNAGGVTGFTLTETFRLVDEKLVWSLRLGNATDAPLELGELGLPMVFAQNYEDDPNITYKQRVLRHSLTCGDHSFAFWMLPTGEGPYLLMTPQPGTRLEYARATPRNWWGEGIWTPYIHAKAAAERFGETEKNRQRFTSKVLAPRGQDGDTAEYGFTFQWVPDFGGVRDTLVREGLLDVHVVPGMTIPRDLVARVGVRCRDAISGVMPEFPAETSVEDMGPCDGYQRYRVHFNRLGENTLTVSYGNGRSAELEFFCTEPLDALVKKRAAFVARKQVRDPQKWYDGLFAEWDMHLREAVTPDNPGGLPRFAACGADDPGLCRAPMIAAKNAAFPKADEIEAVEYYIENFLWGKLQRTDSEDPPYAIHGSDSWLENRNSPQQRNCGGVGGERMWRTFDYTHIILLYFNMYRIASRYPGMVKHLDRHEYLRRAYGTARAFFSVPYNIKMGEAWRFRGWCDWAYKQGNFDESCIPLLIDALREEGKGEEAAWIEGEWIKKVKFFLYDSEFPYGSGEDLSGKNGGTGFASGNSWYTYVTFVSSGFVQIQPAGSASGVYLNDGATINPFTATYANLPSSGNYAGMNDGGLGRTSLGPDVADHIFMARALDPVVTATFVNGGVTWFSFSSARAYNANARAPSFAIGAGVLTGQRGQLTASVNSNPNGWSAAALKVGTNPGSADYDSKEAIAVGGTTPPTYPPGAQPNLFNIQYFDAAGVTNYSPFLGSSDPFPGLTDFSVPGTGEHGYWFQYGTQVPGYSTTFPGDNESHVNITVARIQWGAGDGGTDIVSLYVFHDKDTLREADFNAGALSWDTGHVSAKSTFNYLSIGGGRYFVDELRIATSFNAFVERSNSGTTLVVR